jgi:hypothetical protein
MSAQQSRMEEHRVSGERLVARVKELIHEGNVRRIIVKNDQKQTILEIPLSVGVVGAVLLPALVALGAIAALAANYTLVVEKEAAMESVPESVAGSASAP